MPLSAFRRVSARLTGMGACHRGGDRHGAGALGPVRVVKMPWGELPSPFPRDYRRGAPVDLRVPVEGPAVVHVAMSVEERVEDGPQDGQAPAPSARARRGRTGAPQ